MATLYVLQEFQERSKMPSTNRIKKNDRIKAPKAQEADTFSSSHTISFIDLIKFSTTTKVTDIEVLDDKKNNKCASNIYKTTANENNDLSNEDMGKPSNDEAESDDSSTDSKRS